MGGDRVEKKILWISACVPYDKVAHAGGQTENYYIKYLANAGYEINLVSLCKYKERLLLDIEEYGIRNNVVIQKDRVCEKILRKICCIEKEYNAYQKYAGMLDLRREHIFLKKLRDVATKQYCPDLIILEWTEIVLMIEEIKKIFPNTPVIAIEEDVSYLGFYRKKECAIGRVHKTIYARQYKKLKRLELDALKKATAIIANNPKDRKLLVDDGIDSKRIFVWSPYFNDMSCIERKPDRKKILFYGAMGRKENYLSVEWFIDKVFSKLDDLNLQFIVLGSNPPEQLKKIAIRSCGRVDVTGFVADVVPYFKEAMCFVSPLVLGAGVKIKILEALSSGVPVLTNEIGIEGIEAHDQRDYFYCETPEEYEILIRKMYKGEIDTEKIGQNAREFIALSYSKEESAKKFVKLVERILL